MTTTTKTQPTIATEIQGSALVITFSNGEAITVNADTLTPDIRAAAMMHGLKQKLIDAAAISRNPETGRSASVEDKYYAVREVADRLVAGAWNKVRESGGGTGAGGMLFRALCELYKDKSSDEIRTFLEGKNDKEKAALRASPKIASLIASYKVQTSDVDVDELLAGL